MAFTWTELLDDIKVRAMIPASQNTFTEARLLRIADAALRSKILPVLNKVDEDYYSYDVDTTIPSTGIIAVHSRAVGGALMEAALVNGDERYDLARYFERQITNYDAAPAEYGFFVKRSLVYLVPRQPAGFTTFRQTIMLRPPSFVAVTSAAQITAINTVTGVVTFSSVPSTWATSNTFDIVQAEPHFDTLGLSLAASAVTTGTGGTITFNASDLSSRLAVGDWVSLAGTTPVIQCPVELHPLLAQEAANICLRGQNDGSAYKLGTDEAERLKMEIIPLISPRVKAEGKKLVNRTGMLRRGL